MPDGGKKAKRGYRDLLSEKEYIKNLLANVFDRLGDSIDAIAFSWLVYTLTGSTALTAVTFGVNIGVSVVTLPICGSLVTNMRKKRVAYITDALRALLTAFIVVLYLTRIVKPWMLIVSTGIMSLLEAFGSPAGTSIFPMIVPKEKYTAAMSLRGAVSRGAELVGQGVAGTIIALFGIGAALGADAAMFVISAIILASLKLPAEKVSGIKGALKGFGETFTGGLKYMKKEKLILAICFAGCAINFTATPLSSLSAAFVSDGLKLSAQGLSVMGVTMSLGMLAGTALYPKLTEKFKHFTLLVGGIFGLAAMQTGLALITFVGGDELKFALLGAVMFTLGFANALANTATSVGFMTKVNKDYMARVNGVMVAAMMGAMPIGAFIVAAAANFLSATTLVFCGGIASVAAAFVFLLIKPLKEID